jgi:hypothetical protein
MVSKNNGGSLSKKKDNLLAPVPLNVISNEFF